MFEKLGSYLTENLIQVNAISRTEEAMYQYGFKMMVTYAINIITIFIIGLVMGRLWECILFQAMFLPLRRNAGGYHASTELRCYSLSVVIIVLVLAAVSVIPVWFHIELMIAILLISCAIILILAPVENQNKPLDADEVRVYRRRSGMVLLAESATAMICYFLSWDTAFMVTVLAIFSIAGSLVAGAYTNR